MPNQERLTQIMDLCKTFKNEQRLSADCTIILTGSYVIGDIKKNSDVDLIVVDNIDSKIWGEKNIDGFKINYQIYSENLILMELLNNNTILCSMMTNSIMISGNQEFYNKLRSLSNKVITKATTPVPSERSFLMAKKLKNIVDDIEDVNDSDPQSLLLLRNSLIDYSLHIFAKRHQIILTSMKRRLPQIKEVDSKFYGLVETLLKSATDEIHSNAKALSDYFADLSKDITTPDWAITDHIVPTKRELKFVPRVADMLKGE